MSDGSSAELFGEFFKYLAKQPEPDKKFARRLMKMSMKYDFSGYQLEADKALLKLGLAKKQKDPDYPEDGEMVMYKYEDYQ